MIILIEGEGKTYFCRELHKVIGRHKAISFNDGMTITNIKLLMDLRSRIPYPVLVITANPETLDMAAEMLSNTLSNTQEPFVRMELKR